MAPLKPLAFGPSLQYGRRDVICGEGHVSKKSESQVQPPSLALPFCDDHNGKSIGSYLVTSIACLIKCNCSIPRIHKHKTSVSGDDFVVCFANGRHASSSVFMATTFEWVQHVGTTCEPGCVLQAEGVVSLARIHGTVDRTGVG